MPAVPAHTRHKSIQLNLNLSNSSEEKPKQIEGEGIHEENENNSDGLRVQDEFPQTQVQPQRILTYASQPKNFIYKNITSLQKHKSENSERRLAGAQYMKGRLSMSGI